MLSIGFNFGVDLTLDKDSFSLLINKQLEQLIESIADTNYDGYRLSINKLSQVEIDIEQYSVKITLPLSIGLIKDLPLKDAEFYADIELVLRSTIIQGDLFPLSTNTEILHYEWLKEPIIKVAGIAIGIERLSDFLIDRLKIDICKRIDSDIEKLTSLESIFAKQLKQLSKGINIPDTQLIQDLQLSQIVIKPFQNLPDSLCTSLYLKGETSFFYNKDNALSSYIPLIILSENIDEENLWILEADLNTEFLNKILDDFVKGQKYEIKGRSLTIENVVCIIQSDKHQFIIDFSGNLKGQLQMVLKALFEKVSQTISVESFDLKLNNGSFLLRNLFPIFKPIIESQIQKNATLKSVQIENILNKSLEQLLQNLTDWPGLESGFRLLDLSINECKYEDRSLNIIIKSASTAFISYHVNSMDT